MHFLGITLITLFPPIAPAAEEAAPRSRRRAAAAPAKTPAKVKPGRWPPFLFHRLIESNFPRIRGKSLNFACFLLNKSDVFFLKKGGRSEELYLSGRSTL